MTEKAQNADFRRKPQIFADSLLLLEIQAFGGRKKPQKTADFRRNRRFSQKTAGNRRLGSVTLGASPLARPYSWDPHRCYTFSWQLLRVRIFPKVNPQNTEVLILQAFQDKIAKGSVQNSAPFLQWMAKSLFLLFISSPISRPHRKIHHELLLVGQSDII